MDRVDTYREIIRQVLEEYAQYPPAYGQMEMETIFDTERDHYELVALGWQGKRRVHACLIHIDIRGDKVWLQHDSTDAEIAKALVEKGIPQEDIVLGFHPEHWRQYTGFAVK
ncbi:MAG: XisI protein [Abditibacteriales bacterium]|nr:XisI protein [Abditibacteriales bacterium]MDW8367019.1 XisI protein [Abditibacteriales bacterium]